MAKDLICGMMVDEKKAKFKSDYNAKHFISVLPHAKQHLKRILQSMLERQERQALTIGVAEDIKSLVLS